MSEETHVLTKQEILLGNDTGAESSRVKEPQENYSALWLELSGFMVMGLVSGLSLANHLTQSPSWWCMPCSAKMDAREDSGRMNDREASGRWSDMWCLILTFPEVFQLVEAY